MRQQSVAMSARSGNWPLTEFLAESFGGKSTQDAANSRKRASAQCVLAGKGIFEQPTGLH